MQELKEEFEKSGGGFEEFRIGELFDIHPTKSYGLTNSKLFASKGNTPVVVNSSINNGVGGFADLPPTEKANTITFSDTTSADSIFLQDEDFIGYSHVQGLYPREANKWTPLSLLYFVAVFRHIAKQYQFDYAYKFNRKIAMNMTVLLPTRGKELAFDYMEQYIREVEAELVLEAEDESAREAEAYLLAGGLNDCELTEEERAALEKSLSFEAFRIGELFEVKSSNGKINAHNVTFDGHTPYVVRQAGNNGIRGYIDADPSLKNEKNTISFGQDTATIFYQTDDYFTGDKIKVLKLNVSGATLNEEIACFLIAAMKKAFQGFSWGVSSFDEKIIKGTKISLPVLDNEIDFAYMQAYISAVKKLAIADAAKRKERELAAMRQAALGSGIRGAEGPLGAN